MRYTDSRITAWLVVVGAWSAAPQEPPARAIGTAQPVPGEYSEITAVRELGGRRVLVLDGREQLIHLIELGSGRTQAIGRVGSGPGEYRRVTNMLPGVGDTTYAVDAGNGRLLVIAPDGTLPSVVTQWPTRPMTISIASGADRLGNVYGSAPLTAPAPDADPTVVPDSQALVRVVVGTGGVTRVGVLASPPSRIRVQRSGEKIERVEITRPPFATGDQFAVAPDGRVSIARRGPYRIDVVGPAGQVVRGPVVVAPPIPVGAGERAEYLATLTAAARGRAADMEWPDVLPIFPQRAVFALANGETWVRRNVPAANPNAWYDVFNSRGVRTARLPISRDRRVVAVTASGTWVAATDADGLQHLELYGAIRDVTR